MNNQEFEYLLVHVLRVTNSYQHTIDKIKKHRPANKVFMMESLLETYKIGKSIKTFVQKSDQISIQLCREGDNSLASNCYTAMKCYNKSICHAPTDSNSLANGYSKRSALYFEWKEWKKSLENIEMSRKCIKFPDTLKIELDKREKICIKMIKEKKSYPNNTKHETKQSYEKLSYPKHEKVPFVANCVELAENKEYGRHIIAKRDLNVGDVIGIDTAFIAILTNDYIYSRCTFCLSENSYNLIPCNKCTRAMFCNEKCRDAAFSSFHKFECCVIDGIYDTFMPTEIIALRLVLKLFANHEELEKIKLFVSREDANSMNVFKIDHNCSSISEHYKAIYSLLSHSLERTNELMFSFTFVASLIIIVMKNCPEIRELFKDSQLRGLFYRLLLHHIQSTECNSSTLNHFANPSKTRLMDDYGLGIFPFVCMFNHECISNVTGFNYENNKNLVTVERRIRAGE